MRERKYIKFRVDMYDDTKFKIIDMKPERDLIHYIWTRFVTLAGKVNLEGELYVSKNIPYTIETLGIEFNRGEYQIKLALDVLIELEMIELTLDNIYRVKNFVKHQNIKVNENIKKETENIGNNDVGNLEISNRDIKKIDDKISNKKINNLQDNIPILLEEKKSKKNKDIPPEDIEENEDNEIICFYDGDVERPLGAGESVVEAWSF